jgi:hypothetical protein
VTGLERREELAETVLGSLAGEHPEAVKLLATGLAVASEPLCEFAQPFSYYVDEMADPTLDRALARLRMARALTVAARHPGCAGLFDRLDGASEPPWAELRAALLELRSGLPE